MKLKLIVASLLVLVANQSFAQTAGFTEFVAMRYSASNFVGGYFEGDGGGLTNIPISGVTGLSLSLTQISNDIITINGNVSSISNSLNNTIGNVGAISNSLNNTIGNVGYVSNLLDNAISNVGSISNSLNNTIGNVGYVSNLLNNTVGNVGYVSNLLDNAISNVGSISNSLNNTIGNVGYVSNLLDNAISNVGSISNSLNNTIGNVGYVSNLLNNTISNVGAISNSLNNTVGNVGYVSNLLNNTVGNVGYVSNLLNNTVGNVGYVSNLLNNTVGNVGYVSNLLNNTVGNVGYVSNLLDNAISNVGSISNSLNNTIGNVGYVSNLLDNAISNVGSISNSLNNTIGNVGYVSNLLNNTISNVSSISNAVDVLTTNKLSSNQWATAESTTNYFEKYSWGSYNAGYTMWRVNDPTQRNLIVRSYFPQVNPVSTQEFYITYNTNLNYVYLSATPALVIYASNIYANGSITSSNYYGDGSGLTNVTGLTDTSKLDSNYWASADSTTNYMQRNIQIASNLLFTAAMGGTTILKSANLDTKIADGYGPTWRSTVANSNSWTREATAPSAMRSLAYLGNGEVIYALQDGSGGSIGKSYDYGKTWTYSPVLGGKVASTVYLGNNICVAGGSTSALTTVWRSIDRGVTWTPIVQSVLTNATTYDYGIYNMINVGNGVILASTVVNYTPLEQVGRSTDYGLTWASIPALVGAMEFKFEAGENGTALAYDLTTADQCTVYRSTDYGANWTTNVVVTTSQASGYSPDINAFGSCYAGNNVFLLGLLGTYPNSSLLRSIDNGTTWSNILNPWVGNSGPTAMDNLGGGVIIAFVNTSATGYGAGVNIWKSTDYGLTWIKQLETGAYIRDEVNLIRVMDNGRIIAGGYSDSDTGQGVWRSSPFSADTGEITFQVLATSPAPGFGKIYYGSDNVFYKCTNGTSWTPITTP